MLDLEHVSLLWFRVDNESNDEWINSINVKTGAGNTGSAVSFCNKMKAPVRPAIASATFVMNLTAPQAVN
ncbi:MAG TPA: hypothetical protein VMT94_01235 [Burkholderiales bacterium]|nr:hypothetical protein [Burkholderiales bacterium]